MVGKIGTLINPTTLAYQAALEKAKHLRDDADSLNALSVSAAPVQSWTQALARVLQGYVAGRERKNADKTEGDATTQASLALALKKAAFNADVTKGLTPAELHAKYAGDPDVKDLLEPYDKSFGAGLSKGAEEAAGYVKADDGSYKHPTDLTGPQMNPQAKLIPDGKGGWTINPAVLTFDRAAQATGPGFNPVTTLPGPGEAIPGPLNMGAPQSGGNQAPPPPAPTQQAGGMPFTPANIGQVESGGKDFNPDGSPVQSTAGAMYRMQVMPKTAANPGYGVPPVPPQILNLPPNDPRRAAAFDQLGTQYAQAMSRRFGSNGPAAYNGGPGRMDAHLATGAPLPAETQAYGQKFSKAPDGVLPNGQPYWMVNGQPYDNPNGN